MPRKRSPGHWYSVYVVAYVDEATKAKVERGEEYITQPEQLNTSSFYFGTSQAQAERSFSRAALAAMNNPLAYAVVMQRDLKVIIRLRVERH